MHQSRRKPWARLNRESLLVSINTYSTGSSSQLEAPDHLSEGERKVFDMIKERLEPIKLEVLGENFYQGLNISSLINHRFKIYLVAAVLCTHWTSYPNTLRGYRSSSNIAWLTRF